MVHLRIPLCSKVTLLGVMEVIGVWCLFGLTDNSVPFDIFSGMSILWLRIDLAYANNISKKPSRFDQNFEI